jgi:hypothetical protein
LFETKAHLCFSFLENNVHKGQELLGISQQCNLECYSLQNGMLDCSCLASTQEEADTRIVLHALYSDQLYEENNIQGITS